MVVESFVVVVPLMEVWLALQQQIFITAQLFPDPNVRCWRLKEACCLSLLLLVTVKRARKFVAAVHNVLEFFSAQHPLVEVLVNGQAERETNASVACCR